MPLVCYRRAVTLAILIVFFVTAVSFAADYLLDEPLFSETLKSMENQSFTLNPLELIENIYNKLSIEIKECAYYILIFFIVGSMSAIMSLLNNSFGRSGTGEVAFFACFTLSASVGLKCFFISLSYAKELVDGMTDFITKLSPILASLIIASGKTVSAAAFHPILSAAVLCVSVICQRCIIPLAGYSAVLSVANNMSDQIQISGFCKLISSISKWILALSFTLFTGICGIYGFSAPALDIMGAKTVKFAVGSLVPVVGSFLSDTLETVISGSRMMKNTVGSAGIVAICGISAIPIIKLWVMSFMVRISAAVIEPITDKKISGLLFDLSKAIMILFGMAATVTVLFIICISIILAATG